MSVPSGDSVHNALLEYVPRRIAEWDLDAPGRSWQRVDGALCFVDISGFTALTEKLGRRGRIGAEELTEVLNLSFGSMLRIADNRGGSLVMFGGDALLLMFEGPDSALQAASAGVEMRAALSAASGHQTSVGPIRLRMSVGIHAGPIELYRAGTSHFEVVIVGPTATRTLELEAIADAGEILVSPEVAERLPSGAATAAKGPGLLLRWRSPRGTGPGSPPRRPVDETATVNATPRALRDHLRQRTFESEHRMATVGFVKFGEITDVLEAEGPDELAVKLDELMGIVQHAVDSEGLTFLNSDTDVDGGKVTIVAGVPIHQEDGEGRMLRAARHIIDAKPQLPISVGISRGALFATHVGTETRSVYTVMGDAINLAARLASAAPYGSIYLSPGISERSRSIFELTELEPISVKGKAAAVRVMELGAELGQRPDHLEADLPFVGMDEPLASIRAAIDDLATGRGSVIGITGDAGSGKTRLLREALAPFADPLRLVFRGEDFATDAPYWIFRDPLRRFLGIEQNSPERTAHDFEEILQRAAPGLSASAPLLGDLLHIDVAETELTEAIEPAFRPAQIATSLIELLDSMAPGSLVIVFEDHQWIDDASLAVVDRLSQAATERPWMVAVTSRTSLEATGERFDDLVTLEPLSEAEATALVNGATEAAPLHPHDLESIVARGAGNPLFLTELIRRVRLSGDVDDLPDSLEALLGSSVDRLDPAPRQVLRYASVLGRSFRRAVLLDLLEPDGLALGAPEEEALGQYLEPEDEHRLRFRSALIRDVSYSGISFRLRRALHARAVGVIEQVAGETTETEAEFLAMHSALAGDNDGAWRYSVMAGDRARDGYSNSEAASQYRRALDAASRLERVSPLELIDVWSSLAHVLEEAGRFDSAREAIGSALRLARDDPAARADLHLRRARTWMSGGSFANAKRNITLGRKDLDPPRVVNHRGAAARLDSLEAGIAMYEGRPRQALRAAELAVHSATKAGDEEALARAYIVMDWAHQMLGQPEQARHGEQALELLEKLGQLRRASDVMNNEGGYAYFAGKWDDAVDWYRRSQEASKRAGNVIDAAYVRANIAEVMIGQRRFEEAAIELEESHRVLRAAGALPYLGFVELQLARLDIELGRSETAIAGLEATCDALLAADDRVGSLEVSIHLADALVRSGEPQRGLDVLTRAEDLAGDQGAVFAPAVSRVRSQAQWALQDSSAAQTEAERALEAAREAGMAYEEAIVLDWAISMDEAAGVVPDATAVQRRETLHEMLGIRSERLPAS
jgi:class 3 adenylate cyclase/tetratricopeptide (TPR) repeat protein